MTFLNKILKSPLYTLNAHLEYTKWALRFFAKKMKNSIINSSLSIYYAPHNFKSRGEPSENYYNAIIEGYEYWGLPLIPLKQVRKACKL